MEIVPLHGAPLGVEVRGLDASTGVDAASLAAMRKAWASSGLLLIRGQKMDEPSLVRFSEGFGALELPPASAERSYGDGE